MNLNELQTLANKIREEVGKAVHGQDDIIDLLLISLFCTGSLPT